MDFIEIIYPAGSSSTNDQKMMRHAGQEYGYLLEGELEVTVGFEVFTIGPGDALSFDSSVPHLLRNRTIRRRPRHLVRPAPRTEPDRVTRIASDLLTLTERRCEVSVHSRTVRRPSQSEVP